MSAEPIIEQQEVHALGRPPERERGSEWMETKTPTEITIEDQSLTSSIEFNHTMHEGECA